MEFTVSWDIDGEVGAARKGNKFYPTSHPEFQGWLKANGLTLQEWIDACPTPPKEPEPTWEDKRLSAYRAEADPLLAEAMYQIHIQGIEPAATAWAQKQAEIRSRYPKEVK